jgi:two-component system sensor histidine kinase PhoQ
MDDLAHSLKTPLAVLTGIGDQARLDAAQLETLRAQTERMNQIVSYQLQKAGNLSEVSISKPVDLVVIIDTLLSALEKVYREKAIRVERSLPDSMTLRMDEGDCLEVVGNLLDNAFKYGRERVLVTARTDDSTRAIQLVIEDDGDGLEQRQIERILHRGTRLDEVTEGQGIGLAVVADIVETYSIELTFGRGQAGGMQVSLTFQGV